MSGRTHEINLKFIDTYRKMTECLYRVSMKINSIFPGDFTDLGQGLNRAYFIICMHNGNQDGLFRNCLPYIIGIDKAVFIHRYEGNFKSLFFEKMARFQNGVMLYLRGNDVVAFFPSGMRDAFNHC